MSAVLTFFQDSPIRDDPLHKVLEKTPALQGRLEEIRKEMLSCCAPEVGKNGAAELTVVDTERWDALAAERAAITAQLGRIDELVGKLDAILSQAEKQGFDIRRKTVSGLRAAEVKWRKDHPLLQQVDPYSGRRLPTPSNPELVKLVERAEAIWGEFAASQNASAPARMDTEAPGLAAGMDALLNKTKSLFA